MKYADFDDIDISVPMAVSPVSGDTKLLTHYAATLPPQKCIEIGSGSGFTSVYLAKKGFICAASDIHQGAVDAIRENARVNGVHIEVCRSNLFENVPGAYNLVLFNPPYGHTNSSRATHILELAKSFIPRSGSFVPRLVYPFIAQQRRTLLQEFLRQVPYHVKKQNIILLIIHKAEKDIFSTYKPEIVGVWHDMRLIKFSLSPNLSLYK